MRKNDILAVALMTFAFFLGAGNLVFPPFAGQQAGANLWWTFLGFFIIDVGLSLLAIVAIALQGSPNALTRDLSPIVGMLFWVSVYVVIGPAFAVPRTAVVAFEIGIAPWLDPVTPFHLAAFSVLFFAVVVWLCLFPGKLVTIVGRILTPLLVGLLLAVYGFMLITPHAGLDAPLNDYAAHPITEGMIQGYLTMDTLGALGFGIVIASSVRRLGVQRKEEVVKYTIIASVIAGAFLALVYLGLFYLGGTSRTIAPDATNGAQILTAYVDHLLGSSGLVALSAVIILACLTTAIGVTTACGDYFHHQFRRASYRFWIVLLAILSACVASIGLETLISLSLPVVVALYPVAIALVIFAIARHFMVIPRNAVIFTLAVIMVLSVSDSIISMGLMPGRLQATYRYLPLFESGIGWLLPGVTTFFVAWAICQLHHHVSLRSNTHRLER